MYYSTTYDYLLDHDPLLVERSEAGVCGCMYEQKPEIPGMGPTLDGRYIKVNTYHLSSLL